MDRREAKSVGREARTGAPDRAGAATVLLVGVLLAGATPTLAQEAEGFCFRGRPSCSTFLLIDVHAHYALAAGGRVETTRFVDGNGQVSENARRTELFGTALGADVGLARTLSPEWAVGASIGIEEAESGQRLVGAGRVRRWLGHGLALDLKPAVFSAGTANDADYGAMLGTRLDLAGLGFLSLRWEALHLSELDQTFGSRTERAPGGWFHALSAGGGLSSQAGLVGTLAVAAVVVAVAVVLASAT